VTNVAPEFIGSELSHKKDIIEAIAVDVRYRDSVPVVVMSGFPILGRIVHHLVLKGDSALLTPIGKTGSHGKL